MKPEEMKLLEYVEILIETHRLRSPISGGEILAEMTKDIASALNKADGTTPITRLTENK
jgi:hypothetical protein